MNDVNFSECKFRADMVSYMYAELSAAKSSEFEAHLMECALCTDEFAVLSHARYEVYDWKKLEFDALATPEIKIHFAEEVDVPADSWIEKIRAAFLPGWAVAGVAAAALLITSMFAGFFILSGDPSAEIAANVSADTVAEPPVPELGLDEIIARPETEVNGEDSVEARPRPVQVSAPRREHKERLVRHASYATHRVTGSKEASAKNDQKNIPRLNGFTEEEDTSLRLAELFDDLDTRN